MYVHSTGREQSTQGRGTKKTQGRPLSFPSPPTTFGISAQEGHLVAKTTHTSTWRGKAAAVQRAQARRPKQQASPHDSRSDANPHLHASLLVVPAASSPTGPSVPPVSTESGADLGDSTEAQ